MYNESDGFEGVRKLLALKKYEKPPPRYFQDFSDKVIARIQAEEEARLRPWWQRLGLDFVSLKPAFAGAFGLMLSAGVVFGVLFSNPSSGKNPVALLGFDKPYDLVEINGSSMMRLEETPPSTAPVASTMNGATPFSHMGITAQRVNWTMR